MTLKKKKEEIHALQRDMVILVFSIFILLSANLFNFVGYWDMGQVSLDDASHGESFLFFW